MTSRRDVLRNLFKTAAVAGSGGLMWGALAEETIDSQYALRPPGAKEKDFIKTCIKCGLCAEACPYDTLKLATTGQNIAIGTPFFEPRETPCYMCTNYPCTKACPSDALDLKLLIKNNEKPDINNAKMGLAVIHKESCIAFWGIQCDACFRACPLMNEAITLEYEKNKQTKKHANLKPVVNSEVCTGCGICEHACIVEKAAIAVLPIDKATGKVGVHYIRNWNKEDENKIKEIDKGGDEKDINSALDYLNDDDELFD